MTALAGLLPAALLLLWACHLRDRLRIARRQLAESQRLYVAECAIRRSAEALIEAQRRECQRRHAVVVVDAEGVLLDDGRLN